MPLGAPEATSLAHTSDLQQPIIVSASATSSSVKWSRLRIAAPVRMFIRPHPRAPGPRPCAPSSRPCNHFANWFGSVCRVMSHARRWPPTRSRRSLHRRRPQAEGVLTDELPPGAAISGVLCEAVRGSAMVPRADLRRSPCGCHPADGRNESLIPATAPRLRARRCHRRLCPPQGCSLRIRRGTHPADYPVAHPAASRPSPDQSKTHC